MGLAIFFDDYANTIVVGSTLRPIADRFRVSREKLAYIVDSTAAPIAGVAVISTWIGYEVGLFDDLMRDLRTGISGYQLFFSILFHHHRGLGAFLDQPQRAPRNCEGAPDGLRGADPPICLL